MKVRLWADCLSSDVLLLYVVKLLMLNVQLFVRIARHIDEGVLLMGLKCLLLPKLLLRKEITHHVVMPARVLKHCRAAHAGLIAVPHYGVF